MSVCKDEKEKEKEETSKPKIKTICVFGGSIIGKDMSFCTAAKELGRILAARKINLVYGGGSQGIRSYVASSAFLGGSKVSGVILKPIAESRVHGPTLGTELRTSSIHERMAKMLFMADAFVALPGGLGTLEDLISITSWGQINIHQKPIGLLNTNGFYNGLLTFLDYVAKQGLITQANRPILFSSSNASQLIDQLEAFVPQPNPLIKMVKWCSECKSEESGPDMDLRL